MVKTKNINNVDYKNLPIEEQAYRIIYNYALVKPHLYSILKDIGSDAVEDFVGYAYEYILTYLSRYDSSRGKLSTFIYSTLDYLYPIFIYQVKYNVSFYTARAMTNSRVTPEYREKLINFYDNTKQISIDGGSVSSIFTDEDNDSLPNMALADPDVNVEDTILDGEVNDNKILEVFNEEIDKYIDRINRIKNNSENAKRNKDIILRMTLRQDRSDTLQTIADDYGITRERVRQIYHKFCLWAQKNNNLRNVLGLGRYEPEVKRRRNG